MTPGSFGLVTICVPVPRISIVIVAVWIIGIIARIVVIWVIIGIVMPVVRISVISRGEPVVV